MNKFDGNARMQETGIHYMGAGLKNDVNADDLKNAQIQMEKEQMEYATRIFEQDKDCKSYEDKILCPVGNRVIVLPYESHPYRVPFHQRSSGLIIGDFQTGASYKSNETGEQEAAQKGIWCCKVIAVGVDCKCVKKDDDVYINFQMAAPLPFGGKGYYSISETSIICSVRENGK